MDTADLIQFIYGLARLLVRSRAEEFVSLTLVRFRVRVSRSIKLYHAYVVANIVSYIYSYVLTAFLHSLDRKVKCISASDNENSRGSRELAFPAIKTDGHAVSKLSYNLAIERILKLKV